MTEANYVVFGVLCQHSDCPEEHHYKVSHKDEMHDMKNRVQCWHEKQVHADMCAYLLQQHEQCLWQAFHDELKGLDLKGDLK